MNEVELLGEAKYVGSVKESGGVWILMEANKIYSVQAKRGNNLLTWTTKEDAEEFASQTKHKGLSGIFVPIEYIIDSWLQSELMGIVEVSASPRNGVSTLTYTAEEYIDTFKT